MKNYHLFKDEMKDKYESLLYTRSMGCESFKAFFFHAKSHHIYFVVTHIQPKEVCKFYSILVLEVTSWDNILAPPPHGVKEWI